MKLRIEIDEHDGYIYVRENLGTGWKQKFRGTSMNHVLKTLAAKYGEKDGANQEKSSGRKTGKRAVEAVQS